MNENALAVWDSRCRWHEWPHWREANAWSETQGIPVDDTYRIEIYLMDVPYARVFRFAVDERGRTYRDPETGDVAVADPVTVMLSSLPARELLEFTS